MATTATGAAAPDTPAAPVKTRKHKAPAAKLPWWLWIAVAAIVVFCLAPFYWLVNVSLKTGPDLSGSDVVPAAPDAGQLPVDLPERRLRPRAASTARS